MAEESHVGAPLFRDLTAEKCDEKEVIEIESWCPNCEENGTTRIFFTKIPFFREIIIMSFSCPHCGESNNEIQPGGKVQDKGCKYSVEIKSHEDMNRQVVKTGSASVTIPSLDFEIPANTQKGELTTVEGLISKAIEGLEQDQPVRRALHPDLAKKIENFIEKLQKLEFPFVLEIDDPAGNSYIENLSAPKHDPAMTVSFYDRTIAHNRLLGFLPSDYDENEPPQTQAVEQPSSGESQRIDTTSDTNSSGGENVPGGAATETQGLEGAVQDIDEDANFHPEDEVMSFAVNCSSCNSPTQTRMKLVNIPFFKEVVIMSMHCDECGYKTSEVKAGGGIEEKGKRITLNFTDVSDLNRDVLQSETCVIEIPELELHCPRGLNTGKFTTLEGLLMDIKTDLSEKHPFLYGDSAIDERKQRMEEFKKRLDKIIAGEIMAKIVLDDPAGNSYLQNLYAPDPDPEIHIEEYERTEEQNDELGLTNMNTENYLDT